MANIEEWSMGNVEAGIIVGNRGSKVLVYCGKVLPLIKRARAKGKGISIKKTCFINDKMPTVAKKVTTANYIEVSKRGTLRNRARGRAVSLEVQNGDPHKMVVKTG